MGRLEGATDIPAGTRPDPCRAAVRRVSRGLPATGVPARDPAPADTAGRARRPGRTVAALGRPGGAARAVAVVLLVLPMATSGFSYRYTLAVLPPASIAAGLAFTRGRRPPGAGPSGTPPGDGAPIGKKRLGPTRNAAIAARGQRVRSREREMFDTVGPPEAEQTHNLETERLRARPWPARRRAGTHHPHALSQRGGDRRTCVGKQPASREPASTARSWSPTTAAPTAQRLAREAGRAGGRGAGQGLWQRAAGRHRGGARPYMIMGDADDSYDFTALMPFVEKLRGGLRSGDGQSVSGRHRAGRDAARCTATSATRC